MGLYTPKKIPINWYQYEMKFSLELLNAFVLNIESQVKTSIEEYQNKKETIIIDDRPEEIGSHHIFNLHNGLDSQTWHLDSIFLEHFPNLQRRSAFLSLYGFLEYELDKLCILFKETNNFSIELKDLKYLGIDRSITFLTKVANLPIDKGNDKWGEIKSIQKIRNLIVHNDGKLIDINGIPRAKEIEIVKKNEFLTGDTEILINDGFLNSTLGKFEELFKYIDSLVKNCN
jgi:hypothetical protein